MYRRVSPAYRAAKGAEERAAETERRLMARQEALFWLLAARPGEEAEETRRRFFRELPPARGELRRVQLGSLRVLRELREAGREEAPSLFLAAGSLLGAVRHRGFVPWDDDIDLYLPHRELRLLARRLEGHPRLELLPWLSARRTPWGPRAWITWRAVLRGSPGWADLFALDFFSCAPGEEGTLWEEISAAQRKAARALAKAAFRLPRRYWEEPLRDRDHRRRAEEALARAYAALPVREEGEWASLGLDGHFAAGLGLYPAAALFPLGELPFEGEPLPVPREPEALLKKSYGDWLSFPAALSPGHPWLHGRDGSPSSGAD